MTEAEYILADLIILKMPINQPFSVTGLYHNILLGKHDLYSQETIDQIHKLVISNTSSIRDFLLRQEYISVHDYRLPKDISTPTGQKAQELGGHKQYLAWKAKQDKSKRFENLPNKYWYIWTPLLFFLGYFADIFKDDVKSSILKNKSQDTSQLHHTIEALRDSVQELLHQPKETLYIQQSPLTQPKSDSIK